MSTNIEAVLVEVAKALNATDIIWAVGASVLLHQYELVKNPVDIDICIKLTDTETVDKILSEIGTKLPSRESDIYLTDYFSEYVIKGIHIDVMAGLKIKTDYSIFEYLFDEESTPHQININDIFVPFATIEEWYVLYQLMPDKKNKVNLITEYFKNNKASYPHLIERMIANQNLPEEIKLEIKKLL